MLNDFICDGNLSMSKGLEYLLVRFAHIRLNVIKQESEGLTAKLVHLLQLPLQTNDFFWAWVGQIQARREGVYEGDVLLIGSFYETGQVICRFNIIINE